MKLITRFERAQTAPARWIAAHKKGMLGKNWDEVTEVMEKLQPPIDPDQIDSLIGNDSWTRIARCSECGKDADPILEIGEEPDYESHTAYLCLPCLAKVVTLAKGE